MDKDELSGQMEQPTLVTFSKVNTMDLVYMYIPAERNSLEGGKMG